MAWGWTDARNEIFAQGGTPQYTTQADVARAIIWKRPGGLRSLIQIPTVGDVIQPGKSFVSLLRGTFRAWDDLVFRPLTKASPHLLGFAIGFFAPVTFLQTLGVAAFAYVTPSDWYLHKLATGALAGVGAATLWGGWQALPSRAQAAAAFGTMWQTGGFSGVPGGITGGF